MFPVKENDFVRIDDELVVRIRSERDVDARIDGLNNDLPITVVILHIERDGQFLRKRSRNRTALNFVRRRVLVGIEQFEFERFVRQQVFARNRRSPADEFFMFDRNAVVAPCRFVCRKHFLNDLKAFLDQFHFHNFITEEAGKRVPVNEVSREWKIVVPKAGIREAIDMKLFQDDHEGNERSVRVELNLLKRLDRIARLHVVPTWLVVANPFRPFGLIGLDTHLKTESLDWKQRRISENEGFVNPRAVFF